MYSCMAVLGRVVLCMCMGLFWVVKSYVCVTVLGCVVLCIPEGCVVL